MFSSQFVANKLKFIKVANLFDIRWQQGESLIHSFAQFNSAIVQVDNANQKVFVKTFRKKGPITTLVCF